MQFKNLYTDKTKETKGVFIRYPGEDVEFLIASLNSPAYQREMRRTLGSLPRVKQEDPTISNGIVCDCMAKHVLLGWKGQVKDGDKVLSPDEKTRRELLNAPDFRDWVASKALSNDLFAAEAKAEEKAELEKR